jgi:Tol biopolymer transport system component
VSASPSAGAVSGRGAACASPGLPRLTNSPGNDAHAAWSPDGKWIAFSSARGGFKDEMARGGGGQPATDVFVMRADGRDVRRLTDDAAEEGR